MPMRQWLLLLEFQPAEVGYAKDGWMDG